MVFQFIYNIEVLINTLTHCLDKDGLLFFAVHNIEYIHECAKHGMKFRGVDYKSDPTIGEILIDTAWIETNIRSPQWYDEVLASMGLYRIGYDFNGKTPPLKDVSEEFCSEWHSSKYYIAWYKKDP